MSRDRARERAETQAVLDGIRRLVRELRLASAVAERTLKMSGAQLYVLHALGREDGLSVNELAARTLTHQSSVSVVVAKLVQRGWVKRRRSASDARRLELSLTAAGRGLIGRAPEAIQDRLIAAIERLPRAERSALAGALTKVIRDVGIGSGSAPLFFEERA
jgi:DNA-binding MarR family transcriptional regulator